MKQVLDSATRGFLIRGSERLNVSLKVLIQTGSFMLVPTVLVIFNQTLKLKLRSLPCINVINSKIGLMAPPQ